MRLIGAIVTAAMVVAFGYGLMQGDLSSEGAVLLDLAWGRVSLADIYTGVFIFGCWIVRRERSVLRALPWLAVLVVAGNFGIGPYLLWTSRRQTQPLF